jgi:hypothetical protein
VGFVIIALAVGISINSSLDKRDKCDLDIFDKFLTFSIRNFIFVGSADPAFQHIASFCRETRVSPRSGVLNLGRPFKAGTIVQNVDASRSDA